MRVEIPPDVIGPYIASNAFGVLGIICAWFWPRPTRALFAALFFGASLVNGWTALAQPGVYLTFSAGAMGWYRDFIDGQFSQNPALFVFAIAAGQLAVGICLAVGGRLLRWGVLGGVVFLVAIAPLGFTGSAFPSTVLMACGLLLLQVRRHTESIPSRKSVRAEGASS
jgi:hypothetical protein